MTLQLTVPRVMMHAPRFHFRQTAAAGTSGWTRHSEHVTHVVRHTVKNTETCNETKCETELVRQSQIHWFVFSCHTRTGAILNRCLPTSVFVATNRSNSSCVDDELVTSPTPNRQHFSPVHHLLVEMRVRQPWNTALQRWKPRQH